MNYNVKTVEYLDSIQVRTYRRPVIVSNKIATQKSKTKTGGSQKERTKQQIDHSIESSVNRTVNQIYAISRANRWEYFITLTLDPKKLDSTDFSLVSGKLNIWTNNLKKRYAPDLKYIIVPELHKDKSKWHFHGLFANIGKMPLSFSGKVCVGRFVYEYAKKPFATKIYNLPLWKYGFSTATIIRDSSKASSYITKYITKDLSHILQNQHRYLASQNVDKPLERVFNIDYDELTRIYSKYLGQITYMSAVKLPGAGQEIVYMELDKGKGTPVPCKASFSIFESEIEKPVCMDGNTQIAFAKHQNQSVSQKEIKLSPKPLSAREYLQKLRELKAFLKENPKVKTVYRDINIDFLILQTKRKIMYEEEESYIEENRQTCNDFIPAIGVPFQ